MKAQLDHDRPDAPFAGYIERIAGYPWDRIAGDLDAYGVAVLPGLLSDDVCTVAAELSSLVRVPAVKDQRAWGNGNYRYMRYPLPALVTSLRTAIYPRLAPIANAWNEKMEIGERYPITHEAYLETCHRAGQTIPTSMMLEHIAGQHTLLHQDIYGERAFPLRQGDAVAFAVNHRPAKSARGTARVNLPHGVSRLHSGHRHTLGIIFHDAK
jgi:hypothetical protein